MENLITLSCPTCGGKLEITENIDRFVCDYCGSEYIVKRGGGIVSLAPVVESIQKMQSDTNVIRSELAIRRLEKEILDLQKKIDEINTKWANGDLTQSAGSSGFAIGFIHALVTGGNNIGISFGLGIAVFIGVIVISGIVESNDKQRIIPFQNEIAAKKQKIARHLTIVSD
jgi:DNA-directed RNA polymerase subunit RPC12/RpoP